MIIYIVTYINLEMFHSDWLWAQFLVLPEETQQELIVNRNEEFGFGYDKLHRREWYTRVSEKHLLDA